MEILIELNNINIRNDDIKRMEHRKRLDLDKKSDWCEINKEYNRRWLVENDEY